MNRQDFFAFTPAIIRVVSGFSVLDDGSNLEAA